MVYVTINCLPIMMQGELQILPRQPGKFPYSSSTFNCLGIFNVRGQKHTGPTFFVLIRGTKQSVRFPSQTRSQSMMPRPGIEPTPRTMHSLASGTANRSATLTLKVKYFSICRMRMSHTNNFYLAKFQQIRTSSF